MNDSTTLLLGHFHPLAVALKDSLQATGTPVIAAGISAPFDDVPFYAVDLDDPAALTQQIAALPHFTRAVILPGSYPHGDFMQATPDDWRTAITENVYRMVYSGQAVARRLIDTSSAGALVYLTSTAGLRPLVQTIVQGTTFTILEAIVKMAAVDLAPHNIRANVVAHGWLNVGGTFPTARPDIAADIPAGHTGTADDIAALVNFLLSDAARYITGTIIPVDGGDLLTNSSAPSPYDDD